MLRPFTKDNLFTYILNSYCRIYKTNQDIIMDYEIQNLVKELSAEGSGSPDAGKGKV